MTAAIAYIAFAALVMGIAVYTAPEGYQDSDGWHPGPDPRDKP